MPRRVVAPGAIHSRIEKGRLVQYPAGSSFNASESEMRAFADRLLEPEKPKRGRKPKKAAEDNTESGEAEAEGSE